MKRITPDGVAVFAAQLRAAELSMVNLWRDANAGDASAELSADLVAHYARRIAETANQYITDDSQETNTQDDQI